LPTQNTAVVKNDTPNKKLPRIFRPNLDSLTRKLINGIKPIQASQESQEKLKLIPVITPLNMTGKSLADDLELLFVLDLFFAILVCYHKLRYFSIA
jgi:hypothetical protein